MNKTPAIQELFLSFLRLGLTAFGGPAMIAYIRRMAVEKKHWLDPETFKAGVALCQVIPGATAMQAAAYVGLKARGAMGAAAAFVGFGLPAFLFMMVLSLLYSRFHDLPAAISLFAGLQAIIVGIVANAAVSFGGNTLKGWRDMLIAGAAAALFAFHVSPILVIVLASLAGLLITGAGQKKQGRPRSLLPVIPERTIRSDSSSPALRDFFFCCFSYRGVFSIWRS